MNNKFYTTIEQSKKLLELGLSPETADMHYGNFCPKGLGYADEFKAGLTPCTEEVEIYETIKKQYHIDEYKGTVAWEVLPCWSVGALLELMPNIPDCTILYAKAKGRYGMCITPLDSDLALNEVEADNLIEVVYNMVLWFIENNYIK